MPDGSDSRSPVPDFGYYGQKSLHRRRDHDDDDGECDLDPLHRRQRAKSIWARIGCRDEMDAQQPSLQQSPQVDPAEDNEDTNSFHSKMDAFIAEVSQALPQPLLKTPPKKLASLFKQPLSPSAINAIRELVMIGGGQELLKQKNNNDRASTSKAAKASKAITCF
ncbi:hypothetical protein ABZP36_025914 [Zizania latifolia]